jgi:hypothetical protein
MRGIEINCKVTIGYSILQKFGSMRHFEWISDCLLYVLCRYSVAEPDDFGPDPDPTFQVVFQSKICLSSETSLIYIL